MQECRIRGGATFRVYCVLRRALSALSALSECAWNAACSSLVRHRASPRRSGSLKVTRCQCRTAASYASWTCEHTARI